jgi:GNAT superfamily N-acetyltransferase
MTDVRPGSLDDAADYLALRRPSYPWMVNTVAGVRHQWANLLETADGALFRVDDERGLAGYARCGRQTWTTEEGAANATLVVRADARGRGIGTALLDAVEGHLRRIGARRLSGFVLNTPDAVAWVGKQGFETTGELRYSAAHLDRLPPMPEVPAGVTVATFEEAGPRQVHLVDAEAVVDEPGDFTMDNVGYDQWRRESWDEPNVRRDLSILVLVDGDPASCTWIEADPDSGRVWSGGTGTRRPFRGRGLAKFAKSVGLRRARDAGMTTAYTSNDEVNAPMLAVNEWLGYRPVGSEMSCLKQL